MLKGRWYKIAQAAGMPVSGDIGISFNSSQLLFNASVDYPGATITLISQAIPAGMLIELRIQKTPSGWQIDMMFNTQDSGVTELSPTILPMNNGSWTATTINEAFEYNVVCLLGDIIGEGNDPGGEPIESEYLKKLQKFLFMDEVNDRLYTTKQFYSTKEVFALGAKETGADAINFTLNDNMELVMSVVEGTYDVNLVMDDELNLILKTT